MWVKNGGTDLGKEGSNSTARNDGVMRFDQILSGWHNERIKIRVRLP
ncbi:MAG: hypothetical protein IPM83_15690 [Ignavibacteria bacterium]|nr:hypothetical protein [Ignavibacteria bacterium]